VAPNATGIRRPGYNGTRPPDLVPTEPAASFGSGPTGRSGPPDLRLETPELQEHDGAAIAPGAATRQNCFRIGSTAFIATQALHPLARTRCTYARASGDILQLPHGR